MRATLSFEASVSPLENITWTFTNQSHELIDIFPLSSSRYVLSSNRLSLTILKLSALDSGIYTIAVHTTRNEAATSSITLEIYGEKYKPYNFIDPQTFYNIHTCIQLSYALSYKHVYMYLIMVQSYYTVEA